MTQEDLDKIMPEAIKNIEKHKPTAFSRDSMSNFFKTIQNELETIQKRMASRCGRISNSTLAFLNIRVGQQHRQ